MHSSSAAAPWWQQVRRVWSGDGSDSRSSAPATPRRVSITSSRILLLIPSTTARGPYIQHQRRTWLRALPVGMNYVHVIGSTQLAAPFQLEEDRHLLWLRLPPLPARPVEDDIWVRRQLWTAWHVVRELCPALEFVLKADDDLELRQPAFLHQWVARLYSPLRRRRTSSSLSEDTADMDDTDRALVAASPTPAPASVPGAPGWDASPPAPRPTSSTRATDLTADQCEIDYGGYMRKMVRLVQSTRSAYEVWFGAPSFYVLSVRAVDQILAHRALFLAETNEEIAVAVCLRSTPERKFVRFHQDMDGVWIRVRGVTARVRGEPELS